MLQNREIMKNISYALIGFVGLCFVAWMIVDLKGDSNEAIDETQKQVNQTISVVSLNDDKQVSQQVVDQVNSPVEDITSNIANTDSSHCSTQCRSILSILNEDIGIDDETFQNLEAYTEEIAIYLKDDESQRQRYLQMALTTSDGDKRAFLTNIFKHLPSQQKTKIAENYIESENWRLRADGVILIAGHDMSNSDLAINTLMNMFSTEENAYVKSSILNYLQLNPSLQGDSNILYQLDSVIYSEINPSVRVAALKAKIQLAEQPHHILPDALNGLRINDPELQFASLIAIDRILEQEEKHKESGVFIDSNSIKNELQQIRNSKVYDDDKDSYRLIDEAQAIYLRYFDN